MVALAMGLSIGFSLACSIGGCQTVAGLAQGMERPSARVTGVRVQDISAESLSLMFDVEIANPYALPLPLASVDYALSSGSSSAFLSGQAPLEGHVEARSTRSVQIPAVVSFGRVLKVVEGVRPGAVLPYAAELNLSVSAPGIGAVRVPVRREGTLPVPAAPEVSLPTIRWDQVGLSGASGAMRVKIKNTNQFPVYLTRLNYALTLAGRSVASAQVDQTASFTPGTERELEVPLRLSSADLGLGLLDLLRGQGSGYSLGGTLNLGSTFGPMTIPLNASGQTSFAR
jgi:LEA14-like dessication related protein